jgi:hypothetical protein
MTTKPSSSETFTPQHLVEILKQEVSEESCSRCIEQLDVYISAQFAGEACSTIFMETAMHLDSCTSCSTAYELLYEVTEAENSNRLPTPTTLPSPNLAFLQEKVSLVDQLKQALQVTKESITIQLDQLLLSLLVQEQAGQLAAVRSGGNGRYTNKLFQLSSKQLPGETVPLTIAAFKDNEQAGVCLVEVNIEPPGKSWPELSNYKVDLALRSQTETAVTDEWGTALFPTVPLQYLGTMRLQVSF